MVEKRFGLARRPFPATPDETLYYPASGHEAVLARLLQAVADEEGLALLTGEPGTGKTLLGFCLLERLGAGWITAFLTNSRFPDRAGLFQGILYDLGLPHDGAEQILRLRLTDALLKGRTEKNGTILVLDEAQHLTADLLEELRLLGNLEAGGKKALQVVLLAQSSFLGTLERVELAALRQRLSVRTTVDSLGVDEAVDYLQHHLRAAGGDPARIIDEAGLEVLARGSKGIPRLLNQAANQALLLADAGDLALVDAEAALEALALVGLDADDGATAECAPSEEADETPAFRLAGQTRLTA
ncbi:MAG: AAA family ATPase [Planctomycetes bacterium]|nr:AAA family ATPase [Planctomycetota bacterium]